MFPLLRTWFYCHGKEPSIEFTYDLILSLTSIAVLVKRDPLKFGKPLRRPDLSPLGTMRLHSPSFNFQVLSYKSTNPPGQYPALFVWSKKLCRTTAALIIICADSTLLWIDLMKILQCADKIPKAFSIILRALEIR